MLNLSDYVTIVEIVFKYWIRKKTTADFETGHNHSCFILIQVGITGPDVMPVCLSVGGVHGREVAGSSNPTRCGHQPHPIHRREGQKRAQETHQSWSQTCRYMTPFYQTYPTCIQSLIVTTLKINLNSAKVDHHLKSNINSFVNHSLFTLLQVVTKTKFWRSILFANSWPWFSRKQNPSTK